MRISSLFYSIETFLKVLTICVCFHIIPPTIDFHLSLFAFGEDNIFETAVYYSKCVEVDLRGC